MRRVLTDSQHLAIAYRLCQAAGLFLVTKFKGAQAEYVLYRKNQPHNVRIGKRSTPAATHRFIEHVARVATPL